MHRRILFAVFLVFLVALSSVWTIANAQFATRVYLPLIRTQSNQMPPSATPTTPPASSPITTRVSVASDSTQGDIYSEYPSMSADGRSVAFASRATNLVANDTNGDGDVFVHDRQTGQTTRVSVASNGTQGNDISSRPSISADGRYVAFTSEATNLVANDTNRQRDIFVHDRQTGQTTRVSVASDSTQGDGESYNPSISADGRLVAFASDATNLIANDTNGDGDVFVHDRQTGQTTRVSVTSNGAQSNNVSFSPSVSADGRLIAFASDATNMVANDTNAQGDIFVRDTGGTP